LGLDVLVGGDAGFESLSFPEDIGTEVDVPGFGWESCPKIPKLVILSSLGSSVFLSSVLVFYFLNSVVAA
jgi:hypothetical protein